MTIDGVIIPGKRGRILGSYFRADSAQDGQKQPVVLLCHGFPGNDQLLDFAYLLQERGYHVMTFEYSGSWGSDGNYSLANVIEDTDTVLDYILSTPDPAADTGRIYLLCHSLGGFAGVNVFAKRQEIAAGVFISPANMTDMYDEVKNDPAVLEAFTAQMDEFCQPLNGVDGKKLMEEVARDGEMFRFENVAGGFGRRPVLLVRGTQDTLTPAGLCVDVLWRMQNAVSGNRCERETYDAPHDYLNVRRELRERVLTFFDAVSNR